MDADRFDSLLRSLSTTPSRRNALRFLAGSALGGLVGLEQLKTRAKKGGGKGGKKKCKSKGKTIICHNGQTIEVSNCALKAHEKHGDTIGACTTPPPPNPNACSTPATTCQPNCSSGGIDCYCLPRVGSTGTVCVNGEIDPEPCLSPTTGGCSTPGWVCVDAAVCGNGNLCVPPCVS
jgi:hypothetical protein